MRDFPLSGGWRQRGASRFSCKVADGARRDQDSFDGIFAGGNGVFRQPFPTVDTRSLVSMLTIATRAPGYQRGLGQRGLTGYLKR